MLPTSSVIAVISGTTALSTSFVIALVEVTPPVYAILSTVNCPFIPGNPVPVTNSS